MLGVNGSGKSTLLKLLAGLQTAAGGRVWLEGRELAEFSARERARRIAFLEQSAPGAFALPVKEAVLLGRLAHTGRWRGFGAEDRRLAGQAMEQVGISHLADRDWQRLSGGERQRVHLARALAQQTPWLLLDEPANHLDIAHQQQFMALLRRLKLSVVVTLHDLNLAACYCDRVALLQRGGICAAGADAGEHSRGIRCGGQAGGARRLCAAVDLLPRAGMRAAERARLADHNFASLAKITPFYRFFWVRITGYAVKGICRSMGS